MAPYVDIFSGGPDGSLGKALAAGQATSAATGQSLTGKSVNALVPSPVAAASGKPAEPVDLRGPLGAAVVHAAFLADTPEKWAGMIAMLKANGINPSGYEDFDQGRALAMSRAGTPQSEVS